MPCHAVEHPLAQAALRDRAEDCKDTRNPGLGGSPSAGQSRLYTDLGQPRRDESIYKAWASSLAGRNKAFPGDCWQCGRVPHRSKHRVRARRQAVWRGGKHHRVIKERPTLSAPVFKYKLSVRQLPFGPWVRLTTRSASPCWNRSGGGIPHVIRYYPGSRLWRSYTYREV